MGTSDAYQTEFRRFPILDMNRQAFVDLDWSLWSKGNRIDFPRKANLDQTPIINLFVRVTEKRFLGTNDLDIGWYSSVWFSNGFRSVHVVVRVHMWTSASGVILFFIAKINGIAAVPQPSLPDRWLSSSLIFSPSLLVVRSEYHHPHVVHLACKTGCRLHYLSTYLRKAVDPCTR